MSAIKAFARHQELNQRLKEQLANRSPSITGSNPAFRALQRSLRGMQRQPASGAPTLRPVPVPPAAPPAAFWADLASDYVRGIQRPAPAAEDDAAPAAAAPAPVPTPPSKPSMPREINVVRDLDGRVERAHVGEHVFNFQRSGIDGRIERADAERHTIIYKRDENGRIAGARIESKEPQA